MGKLASSNKTSGTGLDPKVASTLCYIPGIAFVVSLVFFLIESNPKVKWNAAQSLVLTVLVGIVAFPLFFLAPVLFLAYAVTTLYVAYKTYQGETVKLPFVSVLADKLAAAKK